MPTFRQVEFQSAFRHYQRATPEEVGQMAYCVLERAGLLARTNALMIPAELSALSLPERINLVMAASRFASNFALPKNFDRLLQEDILEPEEFEEFEVVIVHIDELDAAIDMAVLLVGPALAQDASKDHDDELLGTLAGLRCQVAKMVRQLDVRPDIVSVASRFLIEIKQRQPVYLDDGRPADWFTRWHELDKSLGSASLADLFK